MSYEGYRDMRVWQSAMELCVEVYRLAKLLPDDERYGLTSQIRRCAASIPSNIAEGRGRAHPGDYRKHLSYARGSLAELETQLEIAVRTQLLPKPGITQAWNLAQSTGKMLSTLLNQTKNK